MLSKKQLKWFKELTQLDGVSGHEHYVANYLEAEYEKYTDEILRDQLCSIIAVKKSKQKDAPKVLVLGHMDEVGFLVKDITKTGVLKMHPVGGWFSQTLLAHRIRLTNRNGQQFAGTIGSIPPHMLSAEERKKPIEIDQMIVDVGAKDKEDVLSMGIQIGDMIVVQGEFEEIGGEEIGGFAPSNLKVMGGELCPRTGYWVLSSQKEKRLYFTKGTLIPKYNKDWGNEYWIFDGEN